MKLYTYKNNQFEIEEGVFYPTKTTELLLKCLDKINLKNKNVLDLGCGCGVVGSILAKYNEVERMNASDISQKSIINAKKNFELNGINANLRVGNLYEPWHGEKFDIIICDVSGVSEKIAKLSGWFGKFAPCDSGIDGTKLGIDIINNSPKHLMNNGKFYMAVLTLSNHAKLMNKLKNCFSNVNIIGEEEYFIPEQLLTHQKLLDKLQINKCISIEKKFGMILWKTMIVEAFNK